MPAVEMPKPCILQRVSYLIPFSHFIYYKIYWEITAVFPTAGLCRVQITACYP